MTTSKFQPYSTNTETTDDNTIH